MKQLNIKTEYLIIAVFVIAKMTLHFIANSSSGYDGDEVMYIDSGNHLAFGYMSFQPLIGFMAWIQNLFNSESLLVNHIFANLASIIIIILLGLITLELGGSWKALLLCLSCFFVAPAFGISHNAFQPTVFDQLFWILCFYVLVRYNKNPQNKFLIYLAIFAALGFMSKVSIVFFLGGLFVSFIIFKPAVFKGKYTWIALSLFLILISPNIIWQIKNNYPVIFHMLQLKKTVLNDHSIIDNIKNLVLSLNPLTIIVWFAGFIIVPFSTKYKNLRLVSFAMFFSIIILAILRAIHEYYYPIVLFGFCIGSVYIEDLFKKRNVIINIYIVLLLLSGIYVIPQSIPVLPLERYIQLKRLETKNSQHESSMPGTNLTTTENKSKLEEWIPVDYEAYYAKTDGEKMVLEIKNIYDSLPADESKTCLIYSDCYTYAGAVNMYGRKYNLPKAFSYHAAYYAWTPDFEKGISIIFIDNSYKKEDVYSRMGYYKSFFNDVQVKKYMFCQYAHIEIFTNLFILYCKDLKYNSGEMKTMFKDRVFGYPPLPMCEKKHILSLFSRSCIVCKIQEYKRKLKN